jgi:hypothetical protein
MNRAGRLVAAFALALLPRAAAAALVDLGAASEPAQVISAFARLPAAGGNVNPVLVALSALDVLPPENARAPVLYLMDRLPPRFLPQVQAALTDAKSPMIGPLARTLEASAVRAQTDLFGEIDRARADYAERRLSPERLQARAQTLEDIGRIYGSSYLNAKTAELGAFARAEMSKAAAEDAARSLVAGTRAAPESILPEAASAVAGLSEESLIPADEIRIYNESRRALQARHGPRKLLRWIGGVPPISAGDEETHLNGLRAAAALHPNIHYYAKGRIGRAWARLTGLGPSPSPSQDAAGLSAVVAGGFDDGFASARYPSARAFLVEHAEGDEGGSPLNKAKLKFKAWLRADAPRTDPDPRRIYPVSHFLRNALIATAMLPSFYLPMPDSLPDYAYLLPIGFAFVLGMTIHLSGIESFIKRREERAAVKAALERGWDPSGPEWIPAVPHPSARTRPWDQILGRAAAESTSDRARDLNAAIEDARSRALAAADVLRLLESLRGDAWAPFVRARHLSYVWSLLKSADEAVVHEAVATLAGASPYELASVLEQGAADADSLETLRAHAPTFFARVEAALTQPTEF